MSALTRAAARAQRENALVERRAAEHACALDFLVYGDGEDTPDVVLGMHVTHIRHAERCVFGPTSACSRRYDPMPYAEAEPDARLYEGTAIGALYGLSGSGPMPALGGWELAPRTVYE